jgi:hypothetical protein
VIYPNENTPGMGVWNSKFNVATIHDYIEREKQKKYVRDKGFADMYHARLWNKELHDKAVALRSHRKQKVSRHLSTAERRALGILQVEFGVSCRDLSEWLNGFIGKTTLNLYALDYKRCEIKEWWKANTPFIETLTGLFTRQRVKMPQEIGQILATVRF